MPTVKLSLSSSVVLLERSLRLVLGNRNHASVGPCPENPGVGQAAKSESSS